MGDDSLGFRYFELPKEGNKNGAYFQGMPQSSEFTYKPYPNFLDYVEEYNSVNAEGGYEYRNGKKPESYIENYMNMFTDENDLVMDFFMGSGTTQAVALKTWATFKILSSQKPLVSSTQFMNVCYKELIQINLRIYPSVRIYLKLIGLKDLMKINVCQLSYLISKQDFDPRNVLNANDTSGNMLEKGQYEALNTLESPNNLYRVVFAVAKLTEGWDVLNLYDIVRIEQEAATNKNATMVEAQLIGRGARYYPFELDGVKSYQRRFDGDSSNKQLFYGSTCGNYSDAGSI